MNSELRHEDCPPAITPEGRFFRVSVIRKGRVESYLCETEAEAKRFAELLAQPPVELKPKSTKPPAAAKTDSANESNVLRFVRIHTPNWKGR